MEPERHSSAVHANGICLTGNEQSSQAVNVGRSCSSVIQTDVEPFNTRIIDNAQPKLLYLMPDAVHSDRYNPLRCLIRLNFLSADGRN